MTSAPVPTSDTIAAIATGAVLSAIGVVRVSGPGTLAVIDWVFRPLRGAPMSQRPDRKLILGRLSDAEGAVLDVCLATVSRGPNSYTGEDTAELQCHGSPAVLAEALANLFAQGVRQALPGEFTKRAFLNGRMDLTAAEAVIDLIEAETADAAANAAGQLGGALLRRLEPVYNALVGLMSHFHAVLDYPDEDIDDFSLGEYRSLLEAQRDTLAALLATADRGRVVKHGVRAVILGRPNAGKSSLLNALAGYDRVIVTPVPGTTRDTVEESVRLGSILLRLTDTAGIRETADQVEKLGVDRSLAAVREADLALLVIDGSTPLTEEDRQAMAAAKNAKRCVCVLSKTDLAQVICPEDLDFEAVIPLSSVTGTGLDALTRRVEVMFASDLPCDGGLLTNLRQETAIRAAQDAISRTLDSLAAGATPDAVLLDVEEALEAMAGLLGTSMREDITNDIFSRFCVGK